MTTPRVVEQPRRLEPTSRDTFLGAHEPAFGAPLADIVALRPRAARRTAHARRGTSALRAVSCPGDSAA